MQTRTLLPMRSCVGRPIQIASVTLADASPEAANADLSITVPWLANGPAAYEAAATHPAIRRAHPDVVHLGADYHATTPGAPIARLGERGDLAEFPPQFVAIAGFLDAPVTAETSRKLWIDLAIELTIDPGESEPLIGGFSFAGVPTLPYYVNGFGESSANFGLPREMRLSWSGGRTEGFLDAENTVTWQAPCAHSGTHVRTTDPFHASRLRLRLADFPRLIRHVIPAPGGYRLVEQHGLVIPWLYFFRYRESTRYAPRVPGGLVAASQRPPVRAASHFAPMDRLPTPATPVAIPALPTSGEEIVRPCPDQVLELPGHEHVTCSAGSLFGQRRGYTIAGAAVEEYFSSGTLSAGGEVHLVIQQTDPQPRSLAGLRFQFPPFLVPKYGAPPQAGTLDVEVWEYDPPEGISPADPRVDVRSDKYARCLARTQRIAPVQGGAACRFMRPTLARFLVVILAMPEGAEGRAVLQEIELIQSAHVGVTQRPSRTQVLHGIRFRIMGSQLAGDFASLGLEDFGFVVEHVVGGERKAVLFEGRTLLDVLELPGAKLHANPRYWDVVVDRVTDVTTVDPDSWQKRRVRSRAGGWNQSRSGDDAGFTPAPAQTDGSGQPLGAPIDATPSAGGPGFIVASAAEVRSQVSQLPPQVAGLSTLMVNDVGTVVGKINALLTTINASLPSGAPTIPALPTPPDPTQLTGGTFPTGGTPSGVAWADIWRDVMRPEDSSIEGLRIYSVPPILAQVIESVDHAATAIKHLRDALSPSAGQPNLASADDLARTVNQALNDLTGVLVAVSPMAGISGVGVNMSGGLGVSGGVGGNIGWNLGPSLGISGSGSISGSLGEGMSLNYQLPTVTHNITHGRTGTITKQASATGYSHAQYATDRYEENDVRDEGFEGVMKRTVERYNDLAARDLTRTTGAQVRWGMDYVDILTGSVPLGITLPATAERYYETTDQTVRVRFPTGVPAHLSVDIAFDLTEELVSDDR